MVGPYTAHALTYAASSRPTMPPFRRLVNNYPMSVKNTGSSMPQPWSSGMAFFTRPIKKKSASNLSPRCLDGCLTSPHHVRPPSYSSAGHGALASGSILSATSHSVVWQQRPHPLHGDLNTGFVRYGSSNFFSNRTSTLARTDKVAGSNTPTTRPPTEVFRRLG